ELAAGGTYEDRQGRIKAGSEFILSTVLGVISTGKGGESGTAVGIKGNENSASTPNVGSANEAKNVSKDAGDLTPTNPNRVAEGETGTYGDRKSTRLNSSHVKISYAVFCLKKKK